jgi:DNA mismatch repair protein MutL
MNKIHILPEALRNKIAAGEIVERPASVLKELTENAIDAGGTQIVAEVEEGGRRLIRVTDNGHGMSPEDARLAFERHATSKISGEPDLEAIRTLGFRGEALPSIASVARVRFTTASDSGVSGPSHALEIRMEGGLMKRVIETAAPAGTQVEVTDLFYNTPARKKFLKSPSTELSHIAQVIQQLALSHPEIHFRLTHNGHEILDTPAVKNLRERVLQVAGQDWLEQLLEISTRSGSIQLVGFVSNPPFSSSSREHQHFFVNSRVVRSPVLSRALMQAYDTAIMKGRLPVAFLFLELPFNSVDVNVHPAKREIRFRDQRQIFDFVHQSVKERLSILKFPDTASFTDQGQAFSSGPAYRPSQESGGSGGVAESMGAYSLRGEVKSAAHTVLEPVVFPLGQIDQTYIVAQVEGELHIVDQHAAHERLIFERLMAQVEEQRLSIQPLLLSEAVELPQAEALRLREIMPALQNAGIELEEFGPRSFLIRGVPALLGTVDGRQLLMDMIEDLEVERGAKSSSAFFQQAVASMSCHAAIKARQKLGMDQMKALLTDLSTLKASTCPHGRPIRVTFNRSDLEKMFRRT